MDKPKVILVEHTVFKSGTRPEWTWTYAVAFSEDNLRELHAMSDNLPKSESLLLDVANVNSLEELKIYLEADRI